METTRADGFDLLVFDWDGTLLDSIASIVRCTQETLRRLDVGPVDEGTIRGAIGLGIRETVEHFVPGCSDRLFLEICQVYRGLWFDTYSRQPVLFAGVEQTLELLRGRGYLMAVATAKSRRGLTRDFSTTGVSRFFDASRTLDEAPSKPAPGMLLDILGELGVPASRALMVGDTTHDLEMASNAAVAAVGVCSGSHPRERLVEAAALACLESVTELPGWLLARGGNGPSAPPSGRAGRA